MKATVAARMAIGGALLAIALSTAASAATLRVGIQEDPDALDPATSGTYAGRFVMASLCDKLVDINPDTNVVPRLATSWTWSDDGKSLTLKLRKGVVFQDETPFNAEAVKANLMRYKEMPESSRKSDLASVSDVVVDDDYTVTLKLSEPFVPLLLTLADRSGMMVSPTAAEKLGSDFGGAPVCSGPYKFVDRSARDYIKLEKFDDYWDAAAYGYDEVIYNYVEDSTVRLSRLLAGDLDVIEQVAPTDVAQVNASDAVKLYSAPGLGVSHLMINFNAGDKADNALSRDKRLREAFDLSIDRNVINQVAFGGMFTPDNQLIPPSNPFYATNHKVPTRDLARAKELIAEAGGGPVPVEITFGNSLVEARVAQIVQSMADEAGFKVTLVPLDSASAVDAFFSGNFEVYIGHWSGRTDPDGTLYPFLACGGSQNVNKYCNEELTDLLKKARRTGDVDERKAIYQQIADIYLDDRPTLPLYHPNLQFAARSNVDGLVIYPDGMLRLQGVHPAK